MARLPKEKPAAPVDPLAWVAEGRWAGERRINLQDHECERAMWFAGRWATPRAPALKAVVWQDPVAALVAGPLPPEGVDGLAAELCCPTCVHFAVCAGAEPAVSCRTCVNIIFSDEGWVCSLDGAALDADTQRAACEAWERFEEAP